MNDPTGCYYYVLWAQDHPMHPNRQDAVDGLIVLGLIVAWVIYWQIDDWCRRRWGRR